MNIIILGGTGFIGRHLANALRQDGHNVIQTGRSAFGCVENLVELIKPQDVVIQMAGANIGQRWNNAYKQELFSSRIDTGQVLAQALTQLPPKRVIATSAIGIYPQRPCGQPLDESCTEVDTGFLGQLGAAWEEVSRQLSPNGLILRYGVVLGADGGALAKMLPAFKFGLGGRVVGGQQCFSWVHIDDLIKVYRWVLTQPSLSGVMNVCAPTPLTQAEFGKTLASVLHRPFLLPMPAWLLKVLFGEGAQVLTHSSCVMPSRLIEHGFEFDYPNAHDALKNLVGQP